MKITENTEKPDIILVKIITGDYVLGRALIENDTITLKKPLNLKFEPMMGGLQVTPYDVYYIGRELDKITFKKSQVLHRFEDFAQELKDKYIANKVAGPV